MNVLEVHKNVVDDYARYIRWIISRGAVTVFERVRAGGGGDVQSFVSAIY
jgi:hypothetical protein